MEPLDIFDAADNMTDEMILWALLQHEITVVDDATEMSEIIASQAQTDSIIPATPHAAPVPRIVLAADSQLVVPMSPLGLAGGASDGGVAAGAAGSEPRTPVNRVSNVAVPLDPASTGWLSNERATAAADRVRSHADDPDELDDPDSAAIADTAVADARARARRRLFSDDHWASASPAASTARQPKSHQARGRGNARRPAPVPRRAAVTTVDDEFPPIVDAADDDGDGDVADPIERLRKQKRDWVHRKKQLNKHRATLVNWLLATHPELVAEYEGSAMNVGRVRVKDLL